MTFLPVLPVFLAGGLANAQDDAAIAPATTESEASPPVFRPADGEPVAPSPVNKARPAQVADFERPSRRRRAPPPPAHWASYGEQILLADLGAVGFGLGAGLLWKTPLPALFAVSVSAPVVHGVHSQPGKAAVSLFLHAALPLLGAYAGLKMTACQTPRDTTGIGLCISTGVVAGGLLGLAVATSMDAVVLAQEPDGRPPPLARRGRFAPALAVSIAGNGDLAVGWRGSF